MACGNRSPGELATRVDDLLPQTQCTRCGYAGCRPYAQAVAQGSAGINQCAPGGEALIAALARLLDRSPEQLSPAHGPFTPRHIARIVEPDCIGCTLCIQACPVDAIAGAPRLLHAVHADWCTGCGLCVPPCPVDCIEMVEPAPGDTWTQERAHAARLRHEARAARLQSRPSQGQAAPVADTETPDARRRRLIATALQRARARRRKEPAAP